MSFYCFPISCSSFAAAGGSKYDGTWKDGRLEGKCSIVVTNEGGSYSGAHVTLPGANSSLPLPSSPLSK